MIHLCFVAMVIPFLHTNIYVFVQTDFERTLGRYLIYLLSLKYA